MFIPHVERSVTLSGELEKAFVCETCNTDYSYTQERMVVVKENFYSFSLSERSAFAKLRARAELKLAAKLGREFDIVPCPVCGWVQKPMIDYRNARGHFGWKVLALLSQLFGIVTGGIFIALAVEDWPSPNLLVFAGCWIGVFVGGGLAVAYLRRLILRRTDPNRGFERGLRDESHELPPPS